MSSDREVFADTAGFLALINRLDSLHDRAVAVQAELDSTGARVITSDWVLTELLSGSAGRRLRPAAIELVRRGAASPRYTVLAANRGQWRRAFEFMSSRPDKEWSLIDCHSILACHDRGIQRVFTHDRHFRQAGLRVLL